MRPSPAARLVPVRHEVPAGRWTIRGGRRVFVPSYRWVDGFQVVDPEGRALLPYLRRREARELCRRMGWRAEVAP